MTRNPGQRPPYETGQIWVRDGSVVPGFERGFSIVTHLGRAHTRWIRRLPESTGVDNCRQVST